MMGRDFIQALRVASEKAPDTDPGDILRQVTRERAGTVAWVAATDDRTSALLVFIDYSGIMLHTHLEADTTMTIPLDPSNMVTLQNNVMSRLITAGTPPSGPQEVCDHMLAYLLETDYPSSCMMVNAPGTNRLQ